MFVLKEKTHQRINFLEGFTTLMVNKCSGFGGGGLPLLDITV